MSKARINGAWNFRISDLATASGTNKKDAFSDQQESCGKKGNKVGKESWNFSPHIVGWGKTVLARGHPYDKLEWLSESAFSKNKRLKNPDGSPPDSSGEIYGEWTIL